ncbi:MAG: B-box zinc finger protein, partial [Candidatus Bathyarchaeia archaeon]
MSLPLCEVCRERNAKYVCQDCGRLICDFCIVPETLICSDCSASMREERFTRQVGFLTPFSILFVSIFLIFLGFFLVILSSVLRGAIEGSGA